MTRRRSPKERREHASNAQERNREQHQRGQQRKLMGKGKEKKRQAPDWYQR